MSDLPHARRFADLIAYQRARTVEGKIFEISRVFPRAELYSLTSQIRRSSRSIGAQIAQAWAKRRYPRHFVSKLTDADAEQLETQHWVHVARSCGYLTKTQESDLIERLLEIGRILHSMIQKADSFCGEVPPFVREEPEEYLSRTTRSLDH